MVDKDLGYIIRRVNFRETSLLASMYTKKFGKVNGLFKGFYTRKKEFSSSLDVFTLNEFILYPRRSEIWLVSYAELLDGYDFLRRDIKKNIAASVFARVIDKGTAVLDSHPEVFFLLKNSLESLNSYDEGKLIYIFMIKFLTISGFKPEFSLCINCHCPYEEEIYFSPSSGGIICNKCKAIRKDTYPISLETSSVIHYIQHNDFPHILRISPSISCHKEIIFILQKFSQYHLHFDPFCNL